MRVEQIDNNCSFKRLTKVVQRGEFKRHPELTEEVLKICKESDSFNKFRNKLDTKLILCSERKRKEICSTLNIIMRYPRYAMQSTFGERFWAFLYGKPIYEEPEVCLTRCFINHKEYNSDDAKKSIEKAFTKDSNEIKCRLEKIINRVDKRLEEKEEIKSAKLVQKTSRHDKKVTKARVNALIKEMTKS